MKRQVREQKNKIWLLSIQKPDTDYQKLYKELKNINIVYLFTDTEEYQLYIDAEKEKDKAKVLRDKTVKFLNLISCDELKSNQYLKDILNKE